MRSKWLTVCMTALVLTGGFSHGALVAHYDFNDSAHLTNDVSGNGKNLAVYVGGPTYTAAGKNGGAAFFTNNTSSVSNGYKTVNNILTPSFTFTVWVKPVDTNASTVVVPFSPTLSGYQIFSAAGKWRFQTYNTTGSTYVISTAVPVVDVWQNLAITFEATNSYMVGTTNNYQGTLKGYVDGELVATLQGARYATTTANYMLIGRRTTSFFNGAMDDVYMYDNALTQTEIQSLIPEPASIGLLGLGALVVLFARRMKS